MKVVKSSTCPKYNAESYVSTNECIILAPAAACYCAPPSEQASKQASKLPFHNICAFLRSPSPSSFAHPVKSIFNHDAGSVRLQSSFARIPRCFAYPSKSVSTFLPSQHIVPQPHLRSASRGRSSTAEPVQAAAECRLLRLLKKLADGCYVFPSP